METYQKDIYLTKGEKFGELTILDEKPIKPKGARTKRILVRCECGAEYFAYLAAIINGRQKRCGNCSGKPKNGAIESRGRPRLLFPDAGAKFGELTVLSSDPVTLPNRKESRILVECSCGYKYNAYVSALKAGRQNRCGQCRTKACGERLAVFNRNKSLIKKQQKQNEINEISV